MSDIEKAMQSALRGSEEELKLLVHHPSMQVISRLLYNSNLTEELVSIIASRRNVSSGILDSIYSDKRWRESYRIRLALCKNPKTPQSISLSNLKSLKIFDMADLTRNRNVPMNVRMGAEAHINEKILSMPLGIKITIARRASSNVLLKLLEDGMREVVSVCLDSPYMTEGILCKIINAKRTASHVIRQIAAHPKWSLRRDVQWSLIRNDNSPLSRVVDFLKNMKTTELRELYDDPVVPPSARPFIYRELMDRQGPEDAATH